MASVREILVDWTTASGAGKVSVFNVFAALDVNDQRTALNTFLTNYCDNVADSCGYSIRQDGREMDEITGTLTGIWNDPVAFDGEGDVAANCVPDASQVLTRWATNTIIDGRFLRGRTFLPGLAVSNVQDGNVTPAVVAAYTINAQAYIDTEVGPAVWHRPKNGAGGSLHGASTGTCWSELAVLRRRRG